MQKWLISPIIMGAAFSILGCATSPVSNRDASLVPSKNILSRDYLVQKDGYGEVVIKRDSGLAGAACPSRVYVDAVAVAELWPAEKVILYLPGGDHLFGAEATAICGGSLTEIRGTVTKDKTIMFRIGYGSGGNYFITQTAF